MSQEKTNGDELNEKLARLQELDVEEEEESETEQDEPIVELDEETLDDEEDTPEEQLPEAPQEEEPSAEAEPEEKKEEKEEKPQKKSRFRRKKSHLKEIKPPMAVRAAKAIESGKANVRKGLATAQAVGNAMEDIGDGMMNASKGARNDVAQGKSTQKPATSTHLREVDPKELKK